MIRKILSLGLYSFRHRLLRFPSSPICLSALQRANVVTIVFMSSSYLKTSELGKLNVLLALIQTISLFGSTLLQNSVARAAAARIESGRSPLLASVFVTTPIALTLAALAQAALIITLPAEELAISKWACLTALLSLTCALSPIATIYCVAVEKTRLASITATLSFLAAITVNYVIDHTHATVIQSVGLLVIQPTSVVVLTGVLVCSHYSRHRVQSKTDLGCVEVLKELWQNVPLLATACLWVPVNVFLQSFYVQRMGLVGLGDMATGERLRQLVVFISSSMSAPLLIRLKKLLEDPSDPHSRGPISGATVQRVIMKSVLNHAVMPAIATILLVIVFSAIGLFGGAHSLGLQLALIVSAVPMATNTMLGQYFVAQSIQWERALADLTLYCLLLVINLMLVPVLGAMGAVAATVVAYTLVCLLLISRIRHGNRGVVE